MDVLNAAAHHSDNMWRVGRNISRNEKKQYKVVVTRITTREIDPAEHKKG